MYICNTTNFGQLNQCLNCIVANGNERPIGYYTNTAAVQPTSRGAIAALPYVLINSTQANKILSETLEQCSFLGLPVEGATPTVTASPSTT